MKPLAGDNPSFRLAFEAAASLMANAQHVIARLPKTVTEPPNTVGVGDIVAAATNLSLAVELLLKTLAIVDRTKLEKQHKLLVLFRTLQDSTRKELRKSFAARIHQLPPDLVVSMEVAITPTMSTPPDAAHTARSESLDDLLQAEEDAFVTWRYLYEQSDSRRPVTMRIELRRLQCVADAVRDVLIARDILRDAEKGDRG
jgi:hypothetical protein